MSLPPALGWRRARQRLGQGTSRVRVLGSQAWSDNVRAVGASDGSPRVEIMGVLALATAVGAYFVLRYGGQWTESDSGLMSQAIRLVANTRDLAPNTFAAYSNGYGYQAVSLAITAFTGLRIETLQQVVYPFVSALLVLPAWALYRELTGSARAATLATLFLLIVPEHLFAVLRASHERLDRAFLMTALWLLIRLLRARDDRQRSAIHVGLVVLMTYGLVATNILFGMSFLAALITALVLSRIAHRGPVGVRPFAIETTSVLRWAWAVAGVIVVAFVLFLYPPFKTSLQILIEIPGRMLAIIFNGGSSFDPYAYVQTAWVNGTAFLVLSSVNFVMLALSVVVWFGYGIAWLRGGRPASIGVWFLWLLFAAFAAQGAASVASDRTGSLSGNVQLRAFSVFATVAAPLIAVAVSQWRPRPMLRRVSSVAFGLAIVVALTKSTLDPAFAHKWLFYSRDELAALQWADSHDPVSAIWIGPDDRVQAAYAMEIGDPTFTYRLLAYEPDPEEVDGILLSDLVLLQSERLGVPVPPLESKNLVYDNGEVQLYR